jgi:ABC-type antimicrobial peptide transport system permease subunit
VTDHRPPLDFIGGTAGAIAPLGVFLAGVTWLASFAYHISMNVLVYLLSALVAIAVALFTVSSQTIRAARTNPANTLRYE